MGLDSAKRVMSGTHGHLWWEGDKVCECSGFQAKIAFNKEDIHLDGEMAVDSKTTSYKGTGNVSLYKVSSRMAQLIGDKIMNGEDLRFTLISELNDPDAYGAERVMISNVSLDDLTLADWKRAASGMVECPFTFTRHKFLDMVDVR